MSDKVKKYKIKYHSITKAWGNNSFCRNFATKMDNWLMQFDESERPLLLNLLKHFRYYTLNRLNSKVIKLNDKFKADHVNDYENAIFAGIEKDFGASYSALIFNTYWTKNDLFNQVEPHLEVLIRNDQVPPIIAIVDDYSGTGGTIIKYISKLINTNLNVKNSKIYVLLLHISEDALKNLNKFAEDENLKLDCIYLDKSDRAFNDDYIFSAIDAAINKHNYQEMCGKYNVKYENSLGYKEIAALVSFEYNTPNNTLGLFWHEIDGFVSLFGRHKKVRTQLRDMQQKAQQNKNFRQQKIIIENIEDTKINAFMVYCIAWGKSFSVARACYDFGLTNDQFAEIMSHLLEEGYLEYVEGKLVPSDKLKKHVFSSRFKGYKEIYYKLECDKKIPSIDSDQDKYLPKNFSDSFKGYRRR